MVLAAIRTCSVVVMIMTQPKAGVLKCLRARLGLGGVVNGEEKGHGIYSTAKGVYVEGS